MNENKPSVTAFYNGGRLFTRTTIEGVWLVRLATHMAGKVAMFIEQGGFMSNDLFSARRFRVFQALLSAMLSVLVQGRRSKAAYWSS